MTALAGLALGSACAPRTPAPGGTATVPTAPTTTADPWAVPATIDAAYVDRVLVKLNHIDGDAVRNARLNNSLTPEFLRLESQIRADDQEMALIKKLYTTGIETHWAHTLLVPGDRRSKAIQITRSTSSCVFASVDESFAAQDDGSGFEPTSWYVGLVPVPQTPDNPTRWAYIYEGRAPDGGPPAPMPC